MSWRCRRDLSVGFVLAMSLIAGDARGQEVTVAYEVGDLLRHLSTVRGIDPQTGGAGALLLDLLQQRFPKQGLALNKNVLRVTRALAAADPVRAQLHAWRVALQQTSKLRFEVAVARVPKAKFAELQLTEKVQTLRDRAPLTALFRRVAARGGSMAIGNRDAVDMLGRVEMKLGGAKFTMDATPEAIEVPPGGAQAVTLHCHRPGPLPAESPAPGFAGPGGAPAPPAAFRCCIQLRPGETQVRELPENPAADYRELLVVTLLANDLGPEPEAVPGEAPTVGRVRVPMILDGVGTPARW